MHGLATDPHTLRVLARQAQDPVAFQVLMQTAEDLETFMALTPALRSSGAALAQPARR